jgi:type I restriction enzyme M protein
VQNRLKEIKGDADSKEEIKVLKTYLDLLEQQAETSRKIKEATAELDKKLYAKYPTLIENEIKTLVVNDKWMATIDRDIHTEMDRISQRLTQRIKELAERYETPLPQQTAEVSELEKRVSAHLEKMGFVWK